jgi:AraC-like DNA-binding protein
MKVSNVLRPTLMRSDMQYWRLQPHARLRGQVLCYFVVRASPSADSIEAVGSDSELLLPDGHSEIVFSFAGGYERWATDAPAQRAIMRPSYVIGGRSHSVLTRNLDHLRLVGAKLDPRAMRSLIGIPLAEFRDATLTLADLNHRPLLELEDQLAQLESVTAIASLLDRFFLRHLATRRTEGDVDALLHRIRAERGTLSIMQWIREEGVEPRSLERRFCAWTGMTPKRYARIMRFKHAYRRWLEPALKDAWDGHLEGYYDQSHFDREFKYFTGVTPRARSSGKMLGATSVTDHLLEGEWRS